MHVTETDNDQPNHRLERDRQRSGEGHSRPGEGVMRDQIERIAEAEMEALDRRFQANKLTQFEYDSEVVAIDLWAIAQYLHPARATLGRLAEDRANANPR